MRSRGQSLAQHSRSRKHRKHPSLNVPRSSSNIFSKAGSTRGGALKLPVVPAVLRYLYTKIVSSSSSMRPGASQCCYGRRKYELVEDAAEDCNDGDIPALPPREE